MELPSLAICNLQSAYADGSLTPVATIEALYEVLDSSPLHPVWIYQAPKAATLERARSLAAAADRGPLYGIPFAVKDNIDVAGMPTTAGCPAYSYIPKQTAFVVRRLLDSGAILVGRTNMDQFATGLVGTRSPFGACASVFDSRYISGGSSSGSAVAVAGGLVSFSLGTDTAGSGRVPAAFNNIVGLKPTRGLLSTSGVVPACRSLDCVSIFSLNCADAETVFNVASGFDSADIFSRVPDRQALPASPLRCGIPRPAQLEFFGNHEYRRLYGEAIARLEAIGATIVEIDLQPFSETAQLLYGGPYVAERFAAVGAFVKRNLQQVDPTVGSIIASSEKYSAGDAYRASYTLEQLKRTTRQVWKTIDALVLPTAPTTYTIDSVLQNPIQLNANLGYYANFVNLLDLSALAVPAGFTAERLPFGVTFIAPAFHEQMLLRAAEPFLHESVAFTGRNTKLASAHSPGMPQTNGWVSLAVLGAHLHGQPLNHQLTDRGSKFSRTVKTAKDYKLYALTASYPPKPGLIRVPDFEGPGIEAEIWMVPDHEFGGLVAAIPPPLGIGTCLLEDGSSVKGFLCEAWAAEGAPEITRLGGWRAFLQSVQSL